MPFATGINHVLIVSGHDDFEPHVGSVGIEDDRIAYVGERSLTGAECTHLIDGSSHVLLPGLVNAHCHGDMTVVRGLGDGMTLLDQNRAFAEHNWFRRWLTDEDLRLSRQLTYVEALLSGTTFMLENAFWNNPKAVEAMTAVGIRGAIALDVRPEFSHPDTLIATADIDAHMQACREAGIVPVVGSVSEEDFEPQRLARIRELLAQFDIRSTAHLAETTWRDQMAKRNCGMSPVATMAEFGYFHDRHIASHMVHLSDADIATTAKFGVKVVNTPVAEMRIADGIAPVPQMLAAGINVALGTDGALWNNSNDMFGEMRVMYLLHSLVSGPGSISNRQLLKMATMHGAAAFGLENEIGTIEVGKSADLILVDISRPGLHPMNTLSSEPIASALVGLVTGRDVSDVFVRGQHVVANHEVQTLDVTHVVDGVQEAYSRICAELGSARP